MKLVTLTELFAHRAFQTPDYQRGYAWQEENVRDFCEDLSRIGPANPRHFMGTLILELSGEPNSPAMVIDGQQRLTSTILLVSALIKGFQKHELKASADRLRKNFLGSAVRPKFKYGSSHDAWPFLALHVFGDVEYIAKAAQFDSAYTLNLDSALTMMENFVSALSIDELNQLQEKIENKLLFNVVEVDPRDFNIHVAFESINHRGRQLTKLELLKNRLIYLTTMMPEDAVVKLGNDFENGRKLRNSVNSTWSDIYSWLGRCGKSPLDEDEFLRTHSLVFFKVDTSAGSWLETLLFKTHFTAAEAVSGRLDTLMFNRYLNSLRLAALLWSHIRRPRDMPALQIQWLERISHVHRPLFDPLILSAYMCILEGNENFATDLRKMKGKDADLVQLLIQIERFIVLVFLLSGRRSHTGRKDFYKLANALYSGEVPDATSNSSDRSKSLAYVIRYVKASITNRGEVIDEEQTFEDSQFPWLGWLDLTSFSLQISRDLRSGDGYYGYSLTQVLLFEYEDHLRSLHRGDRKVKWESVGNETIEHIFPQDFKNWQPFTSKLGPRDKKARCNSYCHSLGNLLLLSRSKNSSLQNNPYRGRSGDSAKKPRFANGGSFSENEVAATFSDWTPGSVEKRGVMLLKFAESRWNFSFSDLGIVKLKTLLVDNKNS